MQVSDCKKHKIINKKTKIHLRLGFFINMKKLQKSLNICYNYQKYIKIQWRKNMDIIKNENNGCLTIKLVGRLDKISSPILDEQLKTELEKDQDIIFDLSDLVYISSAGLRILLATQKAVKAKNKKMTVINVKPDVLDILTVTGFVEILNIEK